MPLSGLPDRHMAQTTPPIVHRCTTPLPRPEHSWSCPH
ncbi:hypothetical protein AG1IA_02569 [Rhizoctonia solani AG-1 IA]|uniref:Uncharacterized protein n=1 Tax=Thanatephorus cucumeris (strain AG1-IA) TaxID=983506 RepID=L8WZI6_THACA|nr:hypothetical protein AG1IA_02569 [Rhizoctonia solani AG-1 IA]